MSVVLNTFHALYLIIYLVFAGINVYYLIKMAKYMCENNQIVSIALQLINTGVSVAENIQSLIKRNKISIPNVKIAKIGSLISTLVPFSLIVILYQYQLEDLCSALYKDYALFVFIFGGLDLINAVINGILLFTYIPRMKKIWRIEKRRQKNEKTKAFLVEHKTEVYNIFLSEIYNSVKIDSQQMFTNEYMDRMQAQKNIEENKLDTFRIN